MAKTILIIDDDPDWIRVITKRLQINGYQPEAAFDSVQAVSQALEVQPDLILLDVLMPAGGGVGVLKNLRKNANTATIPVIAITALSDKQTVEAMEELGVAGYFVKPVDIDKLLEKIKEILSEQ